MEKNKIEKPKTFEKPKWTTDLRRWRQENNLMTPEMDAFAEAAMTRVKYTGYVWGFWSCVFGIGIGYVIFKIL